MLKTASTQKLIEKAHSFISVFKGRPDIIQFVCLMKSFIKWWIKWCGMKSDCSQRKKKKEFSLYIIFSNQETRKKSLLKLQI